MEGEEWFFPTLSRTRAEDILKDEVTQRGEGGEWGQREGSEGRGRGSEGREMGEGGEWGQREGSEGRGRGVGAEGGEWGQREGSEGRGRGVGAEGGE